MREEIEVALGRSLFAQEAARTQRVFMAEDDNDIGVWQRREEWKNAREVQQRLLPSRIPVVAGFSIEAQSTPALEVGGDHYNFFWVGGDRVGVLIGDVSGKGMPAALVATMLRATFRTLTYGNADVRDVLCRVNAWMAKSLRQGMFVTCIYGVLDYQRRSFSFARAGHEPLLLSHANGNTQILSPFGFPLGIMDNAEFRQALEVQCIDLAAGDRLLFFTDGLTEAMNEAGEEFGMQRILYALNRSASALRAGPPLGDLEVLERALQTHIGTQPLADDLTFISIAATANAPLPL